MRPDELFLIVVKSCTNKFLVEEWTPGTPVRRYQGGRGGPSFELGGLDVYPSWGAAEAELTERVQRFVGVEFEIVPYATAGSQQKELEGLQKKQEKTEEQLAIAMEHVRSATLLAVAAGFTKSEKAFRAAVEDYDARVAVDRYVARNKKGG